MSAAAFQLLASVLGLAMCAALGSLLAVAAWVAAGRVSVRRKPGAGR